MPSGLMLSLQSTRMVLLHHPSLRCGQGVRGSEQCVCVCVCVCVCGAETMWVSHLFVLLVQVNDHDSTAFSQELNNLVPEYHGAFVRTWLSTALHRSMRHMLSKRTFVVIGNLSDEGTCVCVCVCVWVGCWNCCGSSGTKR